MKERAQLHRSRLFTAALRLPELSVTIARGVFGHTVAMLTQAFDADLARLRTLSAMQTKALRDDRRASLQSGQRTAARLAGELRELQKAMESSNATLQAQLDSIDARRKMAVKMAPRAAVSLLPAPTAQEARARDAAPLSRAARQVAASAGARRRAATNLCAAPLGPRRRPRSGPPPTPRGQAPDPPQPPRQLGRRCRTRRCTTLRPSCWPHRPPPSRRPPSRRPPPRSRTTRASTRSTTSVEAPGRGSRSTRAA